MESTYLKERLECLAKEAAEAVTLVTSDDFRAAAKSAYDGWPYLSHYPAAAGVLEASLGILAGNLIGLAAQVVSRIEIMEREHERFISIFEALDVELDQKTLATLELIGKRTWSTDGKCRETSPYRDERRAISNAVAKAVADAQSSERGYEHDQATDALVAAGFEYDEEEDAFRRGAELARITLVNGRECRYSWEYDTSDPNGLRDSGKSGEFHRLLALIAPKTQEVTQ